MLVTFHSPASSSITMFGDVATTLLQFMGHSATLPGAVLATDIPAALAKLKVALAAYGPVGQEPPADYEDDGEAEAARPVGLPLRAVPLIGMLNAAARNNVHITWEEGGSIL